MHRGEYGLVYGMEGERFKRFYIGNRTATFRKIEKSASQTNGGPKSW